MLKGIMNFIRRLMTPKPGYCPKVLDYRWSTQDGDKVRLHEPSGVGSDPVAQMQAAVKAPKEVGEPRLVPDVKHVRSKKTDVETSVVTTPVATGASEEKNVKKVTRRRTSAKSAAAKKNDQAAAAVETTTNGAKKIRRTKRSTAATKVDAATIHTESTKKARASKAKGTTQSVPRLESKEAPTIRETTQVKAAESQATTLPQPEEATPNQ